MDENNCTFYGFKKSLYFTHDKGDVNLFTHIHKYIHIPNLFYIFLFLSSYL